MLLLLVIILGVQGLTLRRHSNLESQFSQILLENETAAVWRQKRSFGGIMDGLLTAVGVASDLYTRAYPFGTRPYHGHFRNHYPYRRVPSSFYGRFPPLYAGYYGLGGFGFH